MLKSFFVIAAVFMAIAGITSCSPPPDNDGLASQRKETGHFDGIKTMIRAKITIQQGENYEVRLRGEQELLASIVIDTVGSMLEIDYRPGLNLVGIYQPAEIAITMPQLRQLNILGSGKVVLKDTFRQEASVALAISGSGSIVINSLWLPRKSSSVAVKINGSGACNIQSGRAGVANVLLNGSGSVDLAGVHLSDGEVKILGSGNVKINAADYLNGKILGSGNIYYVGDPDIDRDILGSGNIYAL